MNAQETGVLGTIQEKINVTALKEYFNYNTVIQLLLHGFGGFLVGFLLKKFGRYFIFTVIVGGLALYLLHHFNIASLDISRLKELMGIASNETFNSLMHTWYEWMKHNIDLTLSMGIGFIIGYKVG